MDLRHNDFYMGPAVPRCVDSKETQEVMMVSFKDAPIGARFKLIGMDYVWVKLEGHGDGLICQWHGNVSRVQNFASFVDKNCGIDLDTKVELL